MEKDALRERVWDELEERGIARFPYPPHGKIPNFDGADDAADRLVSTEVWTNADVIKSNPDSPQLPVRRAALYDGKTVYMAVPRLRSKECFFRLDPSEIDDLDHAATIGGSSDAGVPVGPDAMERIELIVAGSVVVDENGGRIGKGEGYSDLEFAILREFGLVDDDTPTATTVHACQVRGEPLPTNAVDVPLELIVTPERVITTPSPQKPAGIDWGRLDEERRDEIPILAEIEPQPESTTE